MTLFYSAALSLMPTVWRAFSQMAVDSPLTASPWRKSLPKHGSTAANWNKPKSYVELILNGLRENISIP